MATLGSLAISLSADIARFTEGMNRAEYLAKQRSDNIVKYLKGIAGAVAGMVSIGALDAAFTRITDMEAALLKMASRLNTSVETLSSLGVVARKTGMDTETFNMTLQRMDRNISNAAKGLEQGSGKVDEFGEEIGKGSSALREMGLKADILSKLPLDQKLLALAEAMQKNVAPSDQLRLAFELGGRGAGGMVVALKEGPETMQKWIDRAKELGIITTDMAKRGAEAKSAAGDLTAAWGTFARELVDVVAPAITGVMNLLTQMMINARKTSSMMIAPETVWEHGATLERRLTIPPSTAYKAALTTPSISPGEKLGKGGDMGLDRMSTIIDTLRKDLSKLTDGSLAEITAWATHMRKEIEKVGKKGADTAVASGLVDKLEIEKKKKAEEDFNLFVAKESGNTYAIIEAQRKADLDKYKGFATAKEVTDAATARKKIEQQAKDNEEVWGLQKNIYDNLASLTPIISEQNFLKTKSLELEILIGKSTQDRKLQELELRKVISKAQADEFRGLQAFEAQAKRTNLTMEQNKGLTGWAWSRSKEADQKGTIKDLMTGAESFSTDFFRTGLQGVLSKDKTTLKKIGETMFLGFVGGLHEGGITRAFASMAKIGVAIKGKEGDPSGALNASAALLSMSGLQLATSAGGLLLSGIGIATNSEALVIAGTVLQMAGLAIQIYEAITATTTAISMGAAAGALSGSAAALTTAAFMLQMVAIKQSIPIIGHSGLDIPRYHFGSDEFPAVLQKGEWVINRDSVSSLKSLYGPGAFDMFNSGRVPAVPIAGGGGGGSPIVVNISTNINPRQEMTQGDYDRHAQMLVKAINRKIGNRGQKIGDGRY